MLRQLIVALVGGRWRPRPGWPWQRILIPDQVAVSGSWRGQTIRIEEHCAAGHDGHDQRHIRQRHLRDQLRDVRVHERWQVAADQKTTMFALLNFENLTQEMAQGKGEHLASLASLMGIPDEQHPAFFALTPGTLQWRSCRTVKVGGVGEDAE